MRYANNTWETVGAGYANHSNAANGFSLGIVNSDDSSTKFVSYANSNDSQRIRVDRLVNDNWEGYSSYPWVRGTNPVVFPIRRCGSYFCLSCLFRC